MHRLNREELVTTLVERDWALTGEPIRLDPSDLDGMSEALTHRIIRAGARRAAPGEALVDEGELAQVLGVSPGEFYGFEGCLALTVHPRHGSSETWIYDDGDVVEIPHSVASLEVAA